MQFSPGAFEQDSPGIDIDGVFHSDAADFGTYGVRARGFVDDDCPSGSASLGTCRPYDDQFFSSQVQSHGTYMVVGIVGANDNDQGIVGIAPQALIYSLKVIFNHNLHDNGECNNYQDDQCIEDDDFIAAWDWAAFNGLDVVTMSFLSDHLGNDAYQAVSTAYYSYDVLPLAGTGNDPGGPSHEPAEWDIVLGVAGVDFDDNNLWNTTARDISGYGDFGTTLAASCSNVTICEAGTAPSQTRVVRFGTSGATAIAGGVAALLRGAFPNEPAGATWNRMVNSSRGSNRVLDAYAAYNYAILSVGINGPTQIASGVNGTWSAVVSGGYPPYTYKWIEDFNLVVSTAQSFTAAHSWSFELELEVTDSRGVRTYGYQSVTVN